MNSGSQDSSDSMWVDDGSIPQDILTAASLGNAETVNSILHMTEIDINEQNRLGWTPLMFAAFHGHTAIIRALLEAGAGTDLQCQLGKTALMMAICSGNSASILLLLENGSQVNQQDHNGWTALFYAVAYRQEFLIKILVDFHADVNVVDKAGFSPLMLAVVEDNAPMVQFLIQNGANTGIQSYTGETAVSIAALGNRPKVLRLLRAVEEVTSAAVGGGSPYPDMASLLKFLGLSHYNSLFEQEDVDLDVFIEMTEEDLKQIGVKHVGPRRKMVDAIARMKDGKMNKVINGENGFGTFPNFHGFQM